MPEPTIQRSDEVLSVDGAQLYYETRGSGPTVVLIGCPMDATAFALLAERFAPDYTVITTDPRGINRSKADNPNLDVTPEVLADDLSLILTKLDTGPVAIFGSSGGAVTALAFAQAHPEQVHTVIAHEPPLEELLDDRIELRAVTEDVVTTYLSGDTASAWAKFLAGANITLPDDDAAQWQGEPDPQQAADERFFFAHTLRPTTWWKPDLLAIRNGEPRIVVGIGALSAGQTCDRTSRVLCTAFGIEPVIFPGDHIGFVENPEAFADRLRPFLGCTTAEPTSPDTTRRP